MKMKVETKFFIRSKLKVKVARAHMTHPYYFAANCHIHSVSQPLASPEMMISYQLVIVLICQLSCIILQTYQMSLILRYALPLPIGRLLMTSKFEKMILDNRFIAVDSISENITSVSDYLKLE